MVLINEYGNVIKITDNVSKQRFLFALGYKELKPTLQKSKVKPKAK